jgi:pyruvate formate lyase activating enzyme
LRCSYCQNWLTSQVLRDDDAQSPPRSTSPQELVELAIQHGAPVIASSYNEPLITADWAVEVFSLARTRGLTCAFISNGNGTEEVLEYLRPHVDLYKVDLKGFTDKAYRDLGGKLANVLSTIQRLKDLGFWVEIVTLTIPGFNDDPAELRDMAEFLAGVDPNLPWHVTAFHPDYKMTDRDRTPASALLKAYDIGRGAGLHFVYPGNLPGQVGDRESTFCPQCGELLIRRRGFLVLENRMRGSGCPRCQRRIPGVWEEAPPPRTAGLGRPKGVAVASDF